MTLVTQGLVTVTQDERWWVATNTFSGTEACLDTLQHTLAIISISLEVKAMTTNNILKRLRVEIIYLILH